MQYGIHLSTFTKRWDEDLEPHIKTAKSLGYDGVEFPLLDLDSFDVDKYKTIIENQAIKPLFATGLSDATDISNTDPSIRRKGIDFLKACIDIVHQFDAPSLSGVIYTPWGLVKSKAKGKTNIDHIIESLREVSDYAKPLGISLNLEVLNRFESYVINTVGEGIKFLKRIKRDNIHLHFDTFHAHIEEKSILNALKKGENHIGHVHFSENDRGIPLTGQIRWDDVYEGLTAIHYDGWICLESFVNENCEVAEGTNVWRQIEHSSLKTAKEGLANMKKIMKESQQ
jgi:D-psicose/D-tagatose/L-ribulose 3-epimerase